MLLLAPQGLPQKNLVDLLLGHRVHIHPLAHVDGFGGGGDEGQDFRAHQAVKHHHIGTFNGFFSF